DTDSGADLRRCPCALCRDVHQQSAAASTRPRSATTACTVARKTAVAPVQAGTEACAATCVRGRCAEARWQTRRDEVQEVTDVLFTVRIGGTSRCTLLCQMRCHSSERTLRRFTERRRNPFGAAKTPATMGLVDRHFLSVLGGFYVTVLCCHPDWRH